MCPVSKEHVCIQDFPVGCLFEVSKDCGHIVISMSGWNFMRKYQGGARKKKKFVEQEIFFLTF
jgi:hypothetical protein